MPKNLGKGGPEMGDFVGLSRLLVANIIVVVLGVIGIVLSKLLQRLWGQEG
jgi:hypothetical protein